MPRFLKESIICKKVIKYSHVLRLHPNSNVISNIRHILEHAFLNINYSIHRTIKNFEISKNRKVTFIYRNSKETIFLRIEFSTIVTTLNIYMICDL